MELLSDPQKDRQVVKVKPPPHRHLSDMLMWKKNGKPDWKLIKDHLSKEGRILKENFIKLIQDFSKIIKNEPNIIQLSDPVVVVGDIHGQFYDLLKIIEVGGSPTSTKYIFLGDFVDRGQFSIECLILLYAIKLNFQQTLFMLRGNHESRQMTTYFNFRSECLSKYDQEIYDLIMDSFDLLPLSCIINGKFLALHGGISPDLITLDDLKKIDRFKEPPKYGIFCDLLWSDPVDNDRGICESIYKFNEVRGCSYFYGAQAVKRFLQENNLISLIRAHEAQLEGYKVFYLQVKKYILIKMHKWDESDFPIVITIFSAPNYCDVYNNKGAIIKFDNNTLNIQQYNYTDHPYLLPNFMDVFSWSIPFVLEKVSEMLYYIARPNESEEYIQEEDIQLNEKELLFLKNFKFQTDDRQNNNNQNNNNDKIIRNKVKFISKMVNIQKLLREKDQNIQLLKTQYPDNKMPAGLLQESGSNGIEDSIILKYIIFIFIFKKGLQQFVAAQIADKINEKRPEFGPYIVYQDCIKPIK
ncbi:ser thr protein phosphatase family protein, putative [Ichthyophthirius multifiliis]|uniref:Serine/threonine-protein phosphatase n=1 Tax=Ichthyophthirius multifiliis TaxID=5932 RepID=G0R5D1_ICHMU|nr:ser thr protein phosphatase family protein, putative [Ichthyophthirius multifiliis]EGR27320.1 ser thr protein phosphatase family protein, putative [Ichthyophthirius multifiliis]|eukprot:XP_004024204.1 ser thr protein phosphatase family protein, putative [Ichthyophthirius multifiliis]